MRIKTLFAAILAAGLTILSGCRQDEDYVLPSLTVDTQTLEFTTGTELSLEAGIHVITEPLFKILAYRAARITGYPVKNVQHINLVVWF